MRRVSEPILFDWAIVKISLPDYPEHARYLFTGVGHGHPRLRDGCQFVTTEVQEVDKDGKWGRTKSRVYKLAKNLNREEFTQEQADEVKGIIRQELGLDVDVEWISIDDWRGTKEGSGRPNEIGA